MNDALKELSEGRIPKDQKIEGKDEFSHTSLHIANIREGLQLASDFRQIAFKIFKLKLESPKA